jgi:cell shape-determining protein MreC
MVKWGDESIEATRNYQEINHVKQGSFVRDTIESLAKIGQLKQEIEYLKGINERMIWHVKRVDELSRERMRNYGLR